MSGIDYLNRLAGPFSRRDLLRLSLTGAVGVSASGWFERLACAAADDKNRRRSCILLWMNGGPSQMDTFDLKPGSKNGGLFKDTSTAVEGRENQRAPAAIGQMDQTDGDRALDDGQRRRSRPRHFICSHRLRARRADSISHARLAGVEGTGPARCGVAQLRQHRPESNAQPGGVQCRFSRRGVRAADRRRARSSGRHSPTATKKARWWSTISNHRRPSRRKSSPRG